MINPLHESKRRPHTLNPPKILMVRESSLNNERKYVIWRARNKRQLEEWNTLGNLFILLLVPFCVFHKNDSFFDLKFSELIVQWPKALFKFFVPVLANIYHVLDLITEASNPIGRMDFHFPCIVFTTNWFIILACITLFLQRFKVQRWQTFLTEVNLFTLENMGHKN